MVDARKLTHIRAVQHVSYLEAVRRVEERSGVEELMVAGVETPENIPCLQRDSDMSHVKVDFVAFTALVINCTVRTERKSEKTGIIVGVAECLLGLKYFTAEVLQGILLMNAPSSQAPSLFRR